MRINKIIYCMIIVWLLTMAACQPQKIQPTDMPEQPVFWITPEVGEGMLFYDGCTHMLAYPAELQSDGTGMLFDHPDHPDIQVFVSSRRRLDSEKGLDLRTVAEGIATEYMAGAQVNFTPKTVQDFTGKEMPALLGDATVESTHIQLLVIIVPDYLFMDMVKDEVIYYMVARAPQDEWSEWELKFMSTFNNFVPKECGGV